MVLGIICFDLQMEKSLMILSFYLFRAVTIEKLVKAFKKGKKKGRISNDSLFFAFNVLKDLLCVFMSCSN